ncbi:MAG: 2-C-methyl-D-erythritol 2,4-cyclodiphosphate synthase [Candidatus Glassbacteria bacterium]
MKIGQGFDMHQLVDGRKLVLGGVTIPFEKGLEGYSDGDALLHAVIDAVLGALSLGDIGTHFPPGEPRWKDVSSVLLLKEVVNMMRGEGYALSNLDSTIMADEPVMSPWIGGMRDEIAAVFGVVKNRVSVKAKSLEGLSAILPHAVIAASAVVSLKACGAD